MEERKRGESYADWYRRTKVLPTKLQGMNVPGPNWIGWRGSVDLSDIQLKVVENLGEDMHNFDLWRSQKRTLAYKPYIEGAADELMEESSLSKEQIQERIRDILEDEGFENADIFVRMTPGEITDSEVEFDIEYDTLSMFNRGSQVSEYIANE